MFTQECFVRSNYSQLRSYLVSIGYIDNKKINSTHYRGYGILTRNGRMIGVPIKSKEFDPEEYIKKQVESNKIIDCGENKDLFLAISALRDDSNEHQWFVWDDDDEGDKWKLYDNDSNWSWWIFECHKATIKELIEHFK